MWKCLKCGREFKNNVLSHGEFIAGKTTSKKFCDGKLVETKS